MEEKKARRGLRLVLAEMAVTHVIISIPIMVLFFNSIGMNQAQIGLSQSLFTLAILVLSVPMGWVADRFSRKWCNVIGNFGSATAFVLYALSQNFYHVVAAEILLGVFMSFTQGVDAAMAKSYADVIDRTGKLFAKRWAVMAGWVLVAESVGYLVGGWIGGMSFRLAIGASALTFAVGGILSLFMHDVGKKLTNVHKNPLKDMGRVAKVCLETPQLRWWMAGLAVASGITKVMVWPMTLILLAAGVPATWLGVAWVVNTMMAATGTWVARRVQERVQRQWVVFVIPICAVTLALIGMSLSLNLVTVWLFVGLGLARGWTSALIPAIVQQSAPETMGSTAMSLAKNIERLLYIPTVYIVGWVFDISVAGGMMTALVIYVPLAAVVAWKIQTFER
jgi:MFS family permease